jgi:hypothetical protein
MQRRLEDALASQQARTFLASWTGSSTREAAGRDRTSEDRSA